MILKEFIKINKKMIDDHIAKIGSNIEIDNRVRELFVLNDEDLYLLYRCHAVKRNRNY
jgi:N-methylhydantoinase B/oxoprolinase/acetone carboxylase alpha subunit